MAELTKYRSVSPFRNLRREMDRLFDDMYPFRISEDEETEMTEMWAPRVDMSENDEEYLIKADLPGVSKKDLKVNYEENRLTVSGERKKESVEEDRDYYRKERIAGTFMRSFTLPRRIKESEIDASFDDGVLTIHIPKVEVSKPKEVKIK